MIVYVYNGIATEMGQGAPLKLKAMLNCDDNTELGKSSSQERLNVLQLVGKNANLCRKFDVIKIETKTFNVWGIIVEPTITNKDDYCEVTVGLGTDGLINDAFSDSGETKSDMFNFLYSQHDMIYKWTTPHNIDSDDYTKFSGYIVAPEFSLPLSQMIRQLFRQGIKVDTYVDEASGYLRFKPYKHHNENQILYSINFDDVLSYEVEFSKDTINSIRLFQKGSNETDKPYFKSSAYLNSQGNVIWSTGIPEQAIKPIASRIEVIAREQDETQAKYDNRCTNEITNILKNQQYNNNIEIVVDMDKWLYKDMIFKYDTPFDVLGDSGYITLKTGEKLNTVINEIEIKNNLATISFGLGNKRLFDRIKGGNG